MIPSDGNMAGEKLDLDDILKNIQPLSKLLAAIKPSPSNTVSDFLKVIQLTCPGSRKLPYLLINVGIHFHPLRHDSWVLVGFKDRVWLGNGVCMFVCKIFDIAYPK